MPSARAPEPAQDRISQDAAYWCLRSQEKDFGEQERIALAQWLAQSPMHQREYEAMMEIWTLSEALPPSATAPPVQQRPARRRWRVAALLVLGLPLLGLAGWAAGYIPSDYQRYQAGTEVSTATLPDGSRLQLNLGTALSYLQFRDHRQVNLSRGEAWFEVQHDAAMPFVVHAGEGDIRVTGTQFNVWTWNDQVVVTLAEGAVQVRGNRGSQRVPVLLAPGMQATYSPAQTTPLLQPARLQQALAWRDGKLLLDDLTLAEALPRLNRYLAAPVYLADRATGELRIGGIYDTRHVADLVQMLPKVLPVALLRNGDGDTVIQSQKRY